MKKSFFIIFFFLFAWNTFSQSGRISGVILDQSTGLPIPEAHVFIPYSTFQTFSDSLGRYVLGPIPEGKWEVQVRANGYLNNTDKLAVIAKSDLPHTVELKSSPNLSYPTLKLAKGKRKRLVQQVTLSFLNTQKRSDFVELLNPDALEFYKLENKSTLVIPKGPLFFSNNQTGYLITSYFDSLILEKGKEIPQTVVYFELPKSVDYIDIRKANRLKVYQKSPAYFLSLVMEGKDGPFESKPNPTISFSDQAGSFHLDFDQPLTINLPEGQGIIGYKKDKLEVRLDGNPVDKNDLTLNGILANQNPLYGVPLDWNADRQIRLKNLEKNAQTMQESIYLHTDRRHYYPAENIYFKAYLSYSNPLMADELSEVLHIELIDSTGYLWKHQVFEIEKGLTGGHISLPDLEQTGNFILRAYTSWSLNYDGGEYVLPIQILSHQNQPVGSPYEFENQNISVFTDKQFYENNEKVKLNIMALDDHGSPVSANLSVSVIDLKQAAFVSEPLKIQKQFSPISSNQTIDQFKFPLEKGYKVEGQLLTEEGENVTGSIQAFINGYNDRRRLKANNQGKFDFPPSNFQNTFEINLQAMNLYGQPIKNINLWIKNYPKKFNFQNYNFPEIVPRLSQPDKSIQPLPKLAPGEIELEEAVVKEQKRKEPVMLYGRADRVIDTKGMIIHGSTIQFLYALSAQVAGMTVLGTPPFVSVRLRGGEPLVLIDGSPANFISGGTLGGGVSRTVYEVLEAVNVFTIERVEVVRRLAPQYGDQGSNGIISIILKTGAELEKTRNNYNLFKLDGFNQIIGFKQAEESRKNFPFLEPFKPTLYWNPMLATDGSSLSTPIEFELNNQKGPFLVEIRGITELGKPIYGTFILNQRDSN